MIIETINRIINKLFHVEHKPYTMKKNYKMKATEEMLYDIAFEYNIDVVYTYGDDEQRRPALFGLDDVDTVRELLGSFDNLEVRTASRNRSATNQDWYISKYATSEEIGFYIDPDTWDLWEEEEEEVSPRKEKEFTTYTCTSREEIQIVLVLKSNK